MTDIVERLRDPVNNWNSGGRFEAADEIEGLRRQLPEEMQHCTILFKECEKGHGRLTATNWIDHGCPHCEIERLLAEIEKLRAAHAFAIKVHDIKMRQHPPGAALAGDGGE